MAACVITLDLAFTKGLVLMLKPFKYDNGIGLQILNFTIGISYKGGING